MIEDSDLDDIVTKWRIMTNEERELTKQKTEELRKKIKIDWKEKPVSSMGTIWDGSRDIAIDLADCNCNIDDDADGVSYAIELAILQAMYLPEYLAWENLQKILEMALDDPIIQKNPVAIDLVDKVIGMVVGFDNLTEKDELLDFAHRDVIKNHNSVRARMAARSKNIKERDWVISEWNNRTDKNQSKASFARQHALLVKTKFGLHVTPTTIERGWLPK